MASKGQKFQKVPLETRYHIVKLHLNEGKSTSYLALQYGVSRNTVETWVRIYKRDGGLDVRHKGRPITSEMDYKERYTILKKYLTYLKEVDDSRK